MTRWIESRAAGWTALYQGKLMKKNDWANHFREPSTQFR